MAAAPPGVITKSRSIPYCTAVAAAPVLLSSNYGPLMASLEIVFLEEGHSQTLAAKKLVPNLVKDGTYNEGVPTPRVPTYKESLVNLEETHLSPALMTRSPPAKEQPEAPSVQPDCPVIPPSTARTILSSFAQLVDPMKVLISDSFPLILSMALRAQSS